MNETFEVIKELYETRIHELRGMFGTSEIEDIIKKYSITDIKKKMSRIIRKRKNRYWKRDKFDYKLFFKQNNYYGLILTLEQDNSDPNTFYYSSDILKAKDDRMYAKSLEDAMVGCENSIIKYLASMVYDYEEILRKFQEE